MLFFNSPFSLPLFRTNALCDKFAEELGLVHFYTSFWICLLNSPSVRLPGTTYLLSHLDKNRSMEDQLYLLGSDLSTLVCSLSLAFHLSLYFVTKIYHQKETEIKNGLTKIKLVLGLNILLYIYSIVIVLTLLSGFEVTPKSVTLDSIPSIL